MILSIRCCVCRLRFTLADDSERFREMLVPRCLICEKKQASGDAFLAGLKSLEELRSRV